ncbi:MAG TPA: amidohydrolase/deacetylase family metallohydrolase [Chloroflexota bacterium]|nr:amidohydrolase/deacetylase family metallohydrolase [Chloroflexota bacterium]
MAAPKYDLLVKGGHVFDPGQELDGRLDVAIAGGRIAAIQPDIPASDARRTIVVRGDNRYVVPGLIDLHTHVAHGATTAGVNWQGADPELAGVHSGATTVVDCGSTGAYNFGLFPTHVLPRAKTRILCLLNVGSHGLLYMHKQQADVPRLEDVDREAINGCIEANQQHIHGIKLRLVGPMVQERGQELVRLAKDIAVEHKLPLMVHIGEVIHESPNAPAITRYLLKTLEPNDILTHLCTHHSGGVMDEHDLPIPELEEARAAGVVLDPASGRGNFAYDVARRQADLGLHPDTISTDMSAPGRQEIIYSLMECMAKFMSLGYSLADVVRMTTVKAAKALHREHELGAIAVGREADLTIMDVVPGKWRFVDCRKQTFTGDQAVIPVQTIRAGELFAPDWGPHPWGWLPEEA